MEEMRVWIEKLRIYELCSRYTLAFDRQDIEAIARCFIEDGVFGFGNRGLKGRERIRQYAQVHATIRSRHITASPVYRIDAGGETARGQATAVLTLPTRSGYKLGFIGWYDDVLRKVDGEWLFSRRWVYAEGLADAPDFPVVTADPEIAALVQPLIDAYRRLGEPI